MRRPRSVREADVSGKNVLVRADLNVPLEDGQVADDTRIGASLPTLRYLLDNGAASVAVCSHLGRPKGEDPAFAMTPVAGRLRELLPDERVRVLENTRFDGGETKNDPDSARRLAAGMDIFVNDAFGSAHRAHASTEGVARLLPAFAGLLLERELEMLGRLLGDVERPFVLVAGGAKVEDKLGVLVNLGQRADAVLVGGKMAEELRDANPLPYEAELPSDVLAAAAFEPDAESRVTPDDAVPEGWLGLDIGPMTRERFAETIRVGRTVFWNGPMGVFEDRLSRRWGGAALDFVELHRTRHRHRGGELSGSVRGDDSAGDDGEGSRKAGSGQDDKRVWGISGGSGERDAHKTVGDNDPGDFRRVLWRSGAVLDFVELHRT